MLCLIRRLALPPLTSNLWPPYPIELLNKPYPKNYKTPIFVSYDGRKGNAIEHVSKFLDTMGQHAGNKELCLREF